MLEMNIDIYVQKIRMLKIYLSGYAREFMERVLLNSIMESHCEARKLGKERFIRD